MSKRKGVSADEKRQRMLDLFHETKDFYQLKELEKLAPKQKGIVAQSVKDVVQSLVDDGLVDSEKIGTSIYFWAFPGKAEILKKQKLELTEETIKKLTAKKASLEEDLEAAKAGREESEERTASLNKLNDLKAQNARLIAEISKYEDNNPETLVQLKKDCKKLQTDINMWTDNIFSIKSWCTNKFGMDETTLNKQFEIPEDLDYVD